jgi:hypothetical protein
MDALGTFFYKVIATNELRDKNSHAVHTLQKFSPHNKLERLHFQSSLTLSGKARTFIECLTYLFTP